jgi:hypothetical protein
VFKTPLVALTLALSAMISASACDDGAEQTISDSSPEQGAVLGGEPPTYPEPVRLTDGEYVSPAGLAEVREAASEAIAADATKAKFTGTVSGIRLYVFGDENRKDYCGPDDFKEFRASEALKFAYLPPGTFAITPQYAAICPDGSTAAFEQEFLAFNFIFIVSYAAGDPAFAHDASADRIGPGTVNGNPAVIIRPLTDAGVGSSAVIVTTAKGAIIVTAHDVPLEITLKIAEGISCEEC